MDPETITQTTTEIPAYLQTLINIVGFLIAATAVWYAYFVKGKGELKASAPTVLSSYDKQLRNINENLYRIANSLEKIEHIIKKNADEEEIARRVEERLAHMRRRKDRGTEN